ncbi:hypothetical protein K378_00338 [Streptomyces sp. Amel2xB2]|uniref:ATP-binding protein n=1 Tax=Streptomyces sp. Amel2xB2 TaxID=1305829 RepID=UPI000DC0277E|nr:ATP-binding protein [Streptomyces sp. Amel2xB2]RAJ71518.1 hypothetical protein K378_00338 [Streptomyces sp. Amel2xB2]
MSLPLTRRIAKTVLLTAAGAASVVGTAGAANAAELPSTADVGGLSTLDDGLGNQVADTASEGASALTPMSSTAPLAAAPSAPDAGVSAGTHNKEIVPEATRFATGTVSGAGRGMEQAPQVERHLPDVHTHGLPTDDAPQTKPAQTPAKQTPAKQTPAKKPAQQNAAPAGLTQNLPVNGVLPKGLNIGGLGR